MLSLCRIVLAACLLATLGAADPPLSIDQWFVGDLKMAGDPQPAVSMHLVSSPVAEGGRSTLAEMAIVLRRPLGKTVMRIEIRQRQELAEDAAGHVVGFRIDHDENGERTIATGHVADGKVIAEVHRLGRIDKQEIVIPAGTEILGQITGQERMVAAVAQAAAGAAPPVVVFTGLELVSGRVALVGSTATYQKADAQGNYEFSVVSDVLPIPSQAVVTPRGDLVTMSFNLGLFKLDIRRAPGPVALLGAQIDAATLVTLRGDPPQGGEVERYRMPEGSTVPVGDFQAQAGDVVTVRREAPPEPLADPAPFLAREPQLETDDEAMRAWVVGIAAGHDDLLDKADAIRLSVRSLITTRDLSVADGSALQTFRSHRGDCTEHANLLCAALRIAGIPARVDVGLLLVQSGERWMWGGHAWVAAWVEGRWIHLDAAYPGVSRSRYIRLGTASGGDGVTTQGAIVAALAKVMGKEIAALGPP